MSDLTEAQYAAFIPAWCGLQTIEQHKDILLCWSLVGSAERGIRREYSECRDCALLNKDYKSAPTTAA